MRRMSQFSTGTADNPPLPSEYHQGQDDGDVDVNKNIDKGSRFSPGTRRHGRFTSPPAAIFVGTALLFNAVAIIFGSGFGGKGSLRSLALVENEDKIDYSVEVVEEQRIIPTDIAEARGDDLKKEEASIPQVLWQTAKSHNAPADVAKIMSTWSIMNPNLDQRLLDDSEVLSFMMQHFNSSVVKAFQNLPLAVMRADFFRLAVMYHEGGIYADVDVSSSVPIHDWQYDDYGPIIDSCDVVIGMDEEVHVSNWGFASVKEHILFQEAIELSLSRFLEHGVDVSYEHFVHYTTGPGVFSDALVYLARKAGCEWDGKGFRAQEMYHSCRPLLKEKYGICYVDEATQRKWFLNHYAASNSNLQSEEWDESWKEAAQELYARVQDEERVIPVTVTEAREDDPKKEEASHLKRVAKEQSNDCLISVGHARNIRLYSQNDEDGALLQILRCMGGHGRKEYFEFGSEGGTEVNTRILRDLYGWKGHLLDGNNENPEISLHKEFFTPSNIVSLLEKYRVNKELDVLSIDTDYDDFWTAREILVAGYKPRVLIIEYNVNFGQSWSVSAEPKPIGEEMSTHWNGDCYFGASAHAMILLMQAFGYTPVFSNDVNLMFVQLEQALNLDMMIPSIERFPGPFVRLLHGNCSGRTWKEVDSEVVKSKASDPALSHTAFAASFSDIVLHEKGYEGNQGDPAWRMFYKE